MLEVSKWKYFMILILNALQHGLMENSCMLIYRATYISHLSQSIEASVGWEINSYVASSSVREYDYTLLAEAIIFHLPIRSNSEGMAVSHNSIPT